MADPSASTPTPTETALRQLICGVPAQCIPILRREGAYACGSDCRGFRRFQKAAELTALPATFLKSESIIIKVAVLT